ncbi:hypothetical protein WMF45_44945 [Sorangium sp. So ce448]|uniref:hypothetical protein n=1 Tax=Sorangium sp. So ce448 TaxID=3133314 RepID=UPI003F6020F1
MHRIIGAGRVVHASAELARARGSRYGLPLEEVLEIDLSHIAPVSELGEVGRLCVDLDWRNKGAIAALCVAMCDESLLRGCEYWISAANTGTDCVEQAELTARVIEEQGLMRGDIVATPRVAEVPPSTPRFRFYSDEETRRILEGDGVEKLRLPPVIAMDARLGARYFKPVVLDRHFHMYAIPLLAPVQQVRRNAERLLRAASRRGAHAA